MEKEAKLHKVESEEYQRQRVNVNVNTLVNTSDWSEEDWEVFEDSFK